MNSSAPEPVNPNAAITLSSARYLVTLIDKHGRTQYYAIDGGTYGSGAPYWSDTNNNHLVTKKTAEEVLRNPSIGYDRVEEYFCVKVYELDVKLFAVMSHQDVIEERNRKESLRRSGLAKLTPEEKKELGLSDD